MHFRFETNPAGGVRVIEEISDSRLCWLEGRNGVGKTLAVRLLELATGGQPYAAETAAWRSLRDNLNTTTIRISGLKNENQLVLQMTPDSWPDQPTNDLELLGKAWLNGSDYDFRLVPNLLRVSRIGGDETITTQFRNRIATDKALVDRRSSELSSFVDAIEAWNERLLSVTGGLSASKRSELEARQAQASHDRDAAAEVHEHKVEVVRKLEMLERLGRELRDLESQSPELDAELSRVDKQVTKNNNERVALEAKLREFLRGAGREQELLANLQKFSRQREGQAERAQYTLAEASDALSRFDLAPEAQQIRRALSAARVERNKLLELRAALATSPDVIGLIDSLIDPLEDFRDSSLDDETIAVFKDGETSAVELRQGLTRRRKDLSESRQYTLVGDLDARLRQVDDMIEGIEEANELRTKANRMFGQLRRTDRTIRETVDKLSVSGGDEYRQTVDKLNTLQKEQETLNEKRADLRYRKSLLEREGSRTSLQQKVVSLKEELSVDGQISDELQQAREEVDEARLRELRCTEDLADIGTELNEFDQRLNSAVKVLETNPTFNWLRSRVPAYMPASGADRADSLSRLEKIEHATQQFQRTLDSLRITDAAVGGALSRLENMIGSSQTAQDRYMSALARFYEREFGELLADPEIRHALFQGGQFTELNLLRGVVSWSTRSGERRRRPVEAFSSGERAFAYVLASLLQRTSAPTDNRMLVLDEFGAFIESGRLDRLLRFLNEQVLKPDRAEQVVIILPLRQQLNSTSSNYSTEEIEDVQERGYFMRRITL